MPKPTSVVNLDPIDRRNKRNKGIIGRFLITRYGGGDPVTKSVPFGHYMFCGSQGSGKTASSIWYAEKLRNRYKKKIIGYTDPDTEKFIKFKEPPKIKLWSNIGLGKSFNKKELFKLIDEFDPYANEIRIVIIDEIHTYFPRGGADKETIKIRDDLIAVFSQLRKRNTFILSTAQVYGRLDKALREQCLYMIACKVSMGKKLINDFIWGDDVICDELGRWAGIPKFIYKHGLPRLKYDTKKLVRE